jgi:hypothetical protein
MNQWDREEQQLENDYAAGLITREEYNRAMRELTRDYRWAAESSAQEAYEREMDRW